MTMTEEKLQDLQQYILKLRVEGNYKEVIENCYRLLDIGETLKNYKSLMVAYVHLATAYYYLGDTDQAFHYIMKHEEICETYGDDYDWINAYTLLFVLHEYTNQTENAKIVLDKSITLALKHEKYNMVSNNYSNYSHIYMMESNYSKALESANKGLEMAKKHTPFEPILELRVKLNLAKAYIQLEEFEESKMLIDNILATDTLEHYVREHAQSYHLLGEWYKGKHLYKEAFQSFTQAQLLVASYQDLYLLKTIQEERCRLCDQMSNIEEGYKVQKEYIELLNKISEKELLTTALRHEIARDRRALEKQVHTDYLTGIYNRNYLDATVNHWLEQAQTTHQSIGCIVFDVDFFKSINDTYGHSVGDCVLQQISQTCSTHLNQSDILARYGGDEFVIFLKDTSLENAQAKAYQILESVRTLNIKLSQQTISVTLSIGVTTSENSTYQTFQALFEKADQALYKAKQNGRNQVYVLV